MKKNLMKPIKLNYSNKIMFYSGEGCLTGVMCTTGQGCGTANIVCPINQGGTQNGICG